MNRTETDNIRRQIRRCEIEKAILNLLKKAAKKVEKIFGIDSNWEEG